MKRNQIAIIVIGLIISTILAIINIFVGGIAFILVLVLAMSFQIMQDTYILTELVVSLSENAKGITVINKGNTVIRNIEVSLVPIGIEFGVPQLSVEGTFTYELPQMLSEVKAVVQFEDTAGQRYSRNFQLSALHSNDDILKPMFPLFGWKGK
jgi:hypothetical protein